MTQSPLNNLRKALQMDKVHDNAGAIRLCQQIEADFLSTGLNDINFLSQFYLNFCNIYLNGGYLNDGQVCLEKFDKVCKGKNLIPQIIEFSFWLNARLLFLSGKYKQCAEYIDSVIDQIKSSKFRSQLYKIRGSIETDQNQEFFSTYNSLSLALGEAEQLGDKNKIAGVYKELSRALNRSYGALGASLLRQGERIAQEINDNELQYSLLIHRAELYVFLGIKYNNDLFTKEAKRLINNIQEEDLKSAGLKEFYWTVKGWILGDIALLEKSIHWNSKAGSWDRVINLLKTLHYTYMEMGDKEKARNIALKGIEAASKCGNQRAKSHFMNLLNTSS